jgi:hypothetical protein
MNALPPLERLEGAPVRLGIRHAEPDRPAQVLIVFDAPVDVLGLGPMQASQLAQLLTEFVSQMDWSAEEW